MHLKAIEMERFKNFDKRVVIPIHRGFTGITGPNGSGKSNITDAILFVLGPSSTRKLRAGKLTELIWNGGPGGKNAKECKVSLTFDNRDRQMNMDADEIKLTRRIRVTNAREGNYTSSFYINGKPCQLNDFHHLLSMARISSEGYNIVQQGDIMSILSKSKKEMRRIIDEVAGIAKYDAEIDKSKSEQQRVEVNMEQTNYKLKLLTEELQELEGDRADALKYLELEKERDETLWQFKLRTKINTSKNMEMQVKRIEEYLGDIENKKKRKGELKVKIAQKHAEIDKLEREIEEKTGGVNRELAERLKELRQEDVKVQATIESAEDRIIDLSDKRERREEYIDKAGKELEGIKARAQGLSETIDEKGGRKEEIDDRLKDIKKNLSEGDRKVKEIQAKISDMQGEMEDLIKDNHNATLEMDRLEQSLQSLDTERGKLEDAVIQCNGEMEDAKWRLEDLRKGHKEVNINIESERKRFSDLRNEELTLEKIIDGLKNKISSLNSQYQKLKAMKDVSQSYGGGRRGVDIILEARNKAELKGIIGTVAEMAQVDEEFKLALATAGGGGLDAVIVEDEHCASAAINYLKKSKGGRAMFLPLTKITPKKPRGKSLLAVRDDNSVGFAIDLIKFEGRLRPAFWYVFRDTVVVRNLEAAKRLMGGVRLVTLDGTLIEAGGAMIGGSKSQRAKKTEFGKAKEDQMREIGLELSATKEEVEERSRRLVQVRKEIHQCEDAIRELRESSSEVEVEKYNGIVKKCTRELGEHKKAIKDLEKEIRKQEEAKNEAENRVSEIQSDIKNKEEEIAREKEELNKAIPEKLSSEMQALNNELDELKEVLADLNGERAELDVRIKAVEEKIEQASGEVEEARTKIKESEAKKEKAEKSHRTMIKSINEIEKKIDKLEGSIKNLRDRKDDARDKVKDMENDIKQIDSSVNHSEEITISLRSHLSEMENKLAEIISEMDHIAMKTNLAEETKERLSKNLKGESDLQLRLTQLKGAIDALGAINQKAIEKYDVLLEKKGGLQEEVEKLEKEREAWLKIENDLMVKKHDMFTFVYDQINQNFMEIYKEITGGGKAELVLENPENPFEGGMDIKARPPGKKFVRLDALSGGEKSLTAMTLIFSIQRYEPSPFYLLDEIDQNLDAINAEKVAMMIKNNSDLAQFVVVSLHKVLLKEAEILYGITSQKGGKADIFSIDIGQLGEEGDFTMDQEVEGVMTDG